MGSDKLEGGQGIKCMLFRWCAACVVQSKELQADETAVVCKPLLVLQGKGGMMHVLCWLILGTATNMPCIQTTSSAMPQSASRAGKTKIMLSSPF